MALIVEDGTGRADAESYCSVAFATAYFSKRGQADAWDAVEDKEAALRLATDYVEQTYRGRWLGIRTRDEQALDWPRSEVPLPGSWLGVRPHDEVPAELANAVAELALRAASAPLLEDLGRETASESVGPISVSYREGGPRQQTYTAAVSWLRTLLRGSGGAMRVTRA